MQLGQAGPPRVSLVDVRPIDPQRDTDTPRSNIREEQAARFPVFEREQARNVDREHVRGTGEASNVGSVGQQSGKSSSVHVPREHRVGNVEFVVQRFLRITETHLGRDDVGRVVESDQPFEREFIRQYAEIEEHRSER